MKTDNNSKKIIVAVIVMILLAITLYIVGRKSSNANAAEVSTPQVEQKRNVSYEELIYAYNKVLHRVLIDRPSYYEDVLVESEEYCRLQCLLFPEDEDIIYDFSPEDSLQYIDNMLYERDGEPETFKSKYE